HVLQADIECFGPCLNLETSCKTNLNGGLASVAGFWIWVFTACRWFYRRPRLDDRWKFQPVLVKSELAKKAFRWYIKKRIKHRETTFFIQIPRIGRSEGCSA